MNENPIKIDFVALTADIVSAHVANNSVAFGDVASLISTVHTSLIALRAAAVPEAHKTPAVSVRLSIKPDHLVCLECGAKLKTLKRHLRTSHELNPDQYRKEFGLALSYPMTAPDYSEARRGMAKSIGLGRKAGARRTGRPKKKP